VKQQGTAVVSHRPFCFSHGLVMAGRGKFGKRYGRVLVDIAEITGNAFFAVGCAFAAFLPVGMIGEMCGEAFTPVAPGVVDLDRIAEPGVDNLMAEGGGLDEGQPQDRLTEQGEGRYAEAGGPAVGHDDVMVVGIRADFLLVPVEVIDRRLQVAVRQFIVFGKEHRIDKKVLTDLSFVYGVRAGDKVDAADRPAERSLVCIAFMARRQAGERKGIGLGDGREIVGQGGGYPVTHRPIRDRIPVGDEGNPRRADHIFGIVCFVFGVGNKERPFFRGRGEDQHVCLRQQMAFPAVFLPQQRAGDCQPREGEGQRRPRRD